MISHFKVQPAAQPLPSGLIDPYAAPGGSTQGAAQPGSSGDVPLPAFAAVSVPPAGAASGTSAWEQAANENPNYDPATAAGGNKDGGI
jgi:hypothetical protein